MRFFFNYFSHFNDGLSDDEEYQNMTEEERNERMKPENQNKILNAKLNLDGASLEISSDDDEPSSSTTNGRKRNSGERMKGEKEKGSKSGRFEFQEWADDDDELPDLDSSPVRSEGDGDRSSGCVTPDPLPRQDIKMGSAPQLTPTQKKNLIIPPKGTYATNNF